MSNPETATPPNWQRRQCPSCGLWVTGIVADGEPVAQHGCSPFISESLDRIGAVFSRKGNQQ